MIANRMGIAVVALAFTCAAVHALDIVKDGEPAAVVVSTAKPEPPGAKPKKGKKAVSKEEAAEALAVRTLVDWIKKISGAELPVAEKPQDGKVAIYVGKAALDAGLKLDDIESPSREGVRIVADAEKILIAGQSEEATLKAVSRFLEELGCRWFMDGPLGEVYPSEKTISVGALNITEKPGLLFRNPKGPSWNGRAWKTWNGAGGEEIAHAHSWGRYVPDEVFKDHPEFFAMGKDGQRKPGGWLCTSNPDLRAYFAQKVIESIDAGHKNPSLSPTDGRGYCQCPACRAQDDPKSIEPSSGSVAMTNRYVDFFDDVARRVAKVHPDSILSFYVYADYTQPPTVERKLSPNLCAVIAPIRYCRLHEIGHEGCTSRMQQLEMIDAWAKDASKLGYYNYMYNLADASLPFFKFTACKKEFPLLKAKGLTMMTMEVLSNWYLYGPHIYLSLRMSYDPSADAAAIMEDYFQKFYGPKAASHMKAYWMGLDEQVGKLDAHGGCFFGLAQAFTPDFIKACQERLDQAVAAAKEDAAYAERVAMHAEGLKNATEYRAICDAQAKGDFAGAQKVFDQMTERVAGLVKKGWANPEYATSYLERFLSKPVHFAQTATAEPNKLIAMLPETWRFAVDKDDKGNERNWQAADFDDGAWPLVHAWTSTLDAQHQYETAVLWYRTKFDVPEQHGDLKLFFAEVDGLTEVYVNGTKINVVPYPVEAKEPKKALVKKKEERQAMVKAEKEKEKKTEESKPEVKSEEAKTTEEKSAAPLEEAKTDAPVPEMKTEEPPVAVEPKPEVTIPLPPPREGQAKKRFPFEVDVTALVKPGVNQVTLRVDHTKITDLYLGGILRPAALIEKGK